MATGRMWSHREAAKGSGARSVSASRHERQSHDHAGLKSADAQIAPEVRAAFHGASVGGPVTRTEAAAAGLWTKPMKDATGDNREFRLHVLNFLDCPSRARADLGSESSHRVGPRATWRIFLCGLAGTRWDAEKEEIVGDREASQMLVRPYRAPWDKELRGLGIGA